MKLRKMDAMELGCLLLRSRIFDAAMGPLGYFGHGVVGVVIASALWVYGSIYNDRKAKQAGVAVLLSIAAAGLLAELLKLGLQMPRPKPRASYGFPSGHASTAFALTGSLGVAFPQWSPFLYLLAILTGISRLYFRAHSVSDVVGGAVVGTLIGIFMTRRFIGPLPSRPNSWSTYLGWSVTAMAGVTAMLFFLAFEKSIQTHRISPPDASQNLPGTVAVDFGTVEARSLLRYGWSEDERWTDGQQSVVWGEGPASELKVPFPSSRDYRMRLHLFPFAPRGPSCQRVEIRINGAFIARLHLEQGWHWYEFRALKTAVKAGNNDIQFYFDYAESPKSRGTSADARRLSVAFDTLKAVPED